MFIISIKSIMRHIISSTLTSSDPTQVLHGMIGLVMGKPLLWVRQVLGFKCFAQKQRALAGLAGTSYRFGGQAECCCIWSDSPFSCSKLHQ